MDKQSYRMITLDFLAGGGDSFLEATTDFITLDTQDEVLVQYLDAKSPLKPELEDRIATTTQKSANTFSSSSDDAEDDESSSGDKGSAGSAIKASAASVFIGLAFALAFM